MHIPDFARFLTESLNYKTVSEYYPKEIKKSDLETVAILLLSYAFITLLFQTFIFNSLYNDYLAVAGIPGTERTILHSAIDTVFFFIQFGVYVYLIDLLARKIFKAKGDLLGLSYLTAMIYMIFLVPNIILTSFTFMEDLVCITGGISLAVALYSYYLHYRAVRAAYSVDRIQAIILILVAIVAVTILAILLYLY